MPDLRELVDAARPGGRRAGADRARRCARRSRRCARSPPRPAGWRRRCDEQLRALRPVIDAALPVAQRLPGVLDGLTPLLDHLRARAPEIISFFTLGGDASVELRRQRQPGPRLGAADPAEPPPEPDRRLQRRGRAGRPAVRPHPGDRRGRAVAQLLAQLHRRGQAAAQLPRRAETGADRDRPDGSPGRGRSPHCCSSRPWPPSTSRRTRGVSGTTVKAEFDDVYPLLPGMHVRVDGAIAGSVGDIEITDEGTALVTMQLVRGHDPAARRRDRGDPPAGHHRRQLRRARARRRREPLGDERDRERSGRWSRRASTTCSTASTSRCARA